MPIYHIYPDGACKGNPGPGGWGIVITEPRSKLDINDFTILETFCGGSNWTTNNVMELIAMREALKYVAELPKGSQVRIIQDSQYVLRGLTEWMGGWKARNFKNVKNSELWMEISELYDTIKVHYSIEFQWVNGHSTCRGNHLADKAANDGVPNVQPN